MAPPLTQLGASTDIMDFGLPQSTSSSNFPSSHSPSWDHSGDDSRFEVGLHEPPENGHHVWGGVAANVAGNVPGARPPAGIVFHQQDSTSSRFTSNSGMTGSLENGENDKDRWVHYGDSDGDGSDSDSAKPEVTCSPETEEAIQRQKDAIRTEVGDDLEKLRARVPRDRDGNPTSIGSVGHAAGSCRACIFVNSKAGCTNGPSCGFCHFPHKRRRNKVRPCKGKRERHSKLLARLCAEIERDPDNFSVDRLKLPPSIVCDEQTISKFVAKLEAHLKEVRSKIAAQVDVGGPHARGSASSSSAAVVGDLMASTRGQRPLPQRSKRVSL